MPVSIVPHATFAAALFHRLGVPIRAIARTFAWDVKTTKDKLRPNSEAMRTLDRMGVRPFADSYLSPQHIAMLREHHPDHANAVLQAVTKRE